MRSRFSLVLFFCLVGAREIWGQGINFAQPELITASTYLDRAAHVDINRDSSLDVVVPNFFAGTYTVSLDENGKALGNAFTWAIPSATYPTSTVPTVIGMGSGHFNNDPYEDILAISNDSVLHILFNQGAESVRSFDFSSSLVVDNFSNLYSAGSVTYVNEFPVLGSADVNNDQNNDI